MPCGRALKSRRFVPACLVGLLTLGSLLLRGVMALQAITAHTPNHDARFVYCISSIFLKQEQHVKDAFVSEVVLRVEIAGR